MTMPMPSDQPEHATSRMYTLTPVATAVLDLPLNTPPDVYTLTVRTLEEQYRVAVMLSAAREASASARAAYRARQSADRVTS